MLVTLPPFCRFAALVSDQDKKACVIVVERVFSAYDHAQFVYAHA